MADRKRTSSHIKSRRRHHFAIDLPSRDYARSKRQTHNRTAGRRALSRPAPFRLFLFPALLIYLELLLRLFARRGFFRNLFYPVIFAIAAGLLLAIITSAFNYKVNGLITMILMITLPLYYALQSFVQNAFKTYMTFGNILKGTGDVAQDFGGTLAKTIIFGIPKIVLFFLPTVLYIRKRHALPKAHRLQRRTLLPMGACWLLISLIAVIAASHGKTAGAYASEYNYNAATQTFGLVTSSRLNLKYAVFGNRKAGHLSAQSTDKKAKLNKSTDPNMMDIDFDKISEKTDDAYVKELCIYAQAQTPSSKNKYTGLFKDKNLILICAEAFSDSAINKELTPTLYRLTHKGFYFSNFYQPAWGGSTSTGEFSMLLGLIPMDNMKSLYKTISINNYFSAGNQLQRQDYYSAAYHNGSYTFYDRHLTHKNLGYDEWIADGNGLEDLTETRHSTDETMFEKTMDEYMDKQPFSIYYMTIDGHAPYDDCWRTEKYMKRVKEVLGDKEYKKTTLNYICYQMCLEDALKTMVDKLEEAGIADDTVICMTGDHYPYGLEKSTTWGNTEDYLSDLYGKEDKTPWGQDHNTWLLWSGCLENEYKDMACEISDPTYSLDILPTLSNLFGWEYDSRLLVGRDVFSDQEPLVVWNNHSWMTSWGRYYAETGEFKPAKGANYTEEDIEETKAHVNDMIFFSEWAVKKDFFGILFGKDPDGYATDE